VKHVESQVTAQGFHIKGIGISQNLDQSSFEVTFAGRTILFAYTSKVGPNGGLIGNVKCFLKQQHPFLQFVDLGGFTYTGAGETNLKAPDDDDFIVIDVDIAALYVALNFIHKALAK